MVVVRRSSLTAWLGFPTSAVGMRQFPRVEVPSSVLPHFEACTSSDHPAREETEQNSGRIALARKRLPLREEAPSHGSHIARVGFYPRFLTGLLDE